MELASIDIVTDGEVRRESYSNRFANALEGIDLDNPGVALDRTGHENPVPRVVGEIHRTRPVEVQAAQFLRRNTNREIKVTLPGPFTMTQQAQNEHYPDEESLAFAYADAVNEEARDLKRAGVDVIQIDEPYLQARPEQARAYGIKAIDRALAGIEGETALHICFGYGHIVKDKPPAYSFLEELNQSSVRQISVQTGAAECKSFGAPEAAGQNSDHRSDRSLRRRTNRNRQSSGWADPQRSQTHQT